jgi:lipopolysaccharide/colanic/teichoic acid biosynthesis glycosyltransferase
MSQQLYIFKVEKRSSYLRRYVGTHNFHNYSKINSARNTKKHLKQFNRKLLHNQNIFMKIKKEKSLSLFYGCLIYHGFKIEKLNEYKHYIYVELKKEKHIEENLEKKYSWFINLPRTGKNGKRIYVYKLRTMQPYSEYLQDYVVEKNGLNNDGTIKNDFRITKLGKFLRKYWLDELPMLLNWFKGDLKLIGVRPLSDSMLSQYPQEYLEIRHKNKPGLIPPYYIDKPKTFDEIIVSEKRYLTKYEKNPIATDIIYFGKFLKVVFLKGVRSS